MLLSSAVQGHFVRGITVEGTIGLKRYMKQGEWSDKRVVRPGVRRDERVNMGKTRDEMTYKTTDETIGETMNRAIEKTTEVTELG